MCNVVAHFILILLNKYILTTNKSNKIYLPIKNSMILLYNIS